MKKYRPYQAGFIVLYVLVLICLGDAAYTVYCQLTNTANPTVQSFAMFTYLFAVLSVLYVRMFGTARVEIDEESFHFVNPVYIRPENGAKRAMFLYRQGDLDIHLVDKTFALKDVVRYGYIEDLGHARLDKSQTTENNKLFPVHEIAFETSDGKRYHMNAGNYSIKQLRAMVAQIYAATKFAPEGSLAKLLPDAKP